MAGFHIKRITASGEYAKSATVEFELGLNIIMGHSNTGKTCILKCFEFALGKGKLTNPFKPNSKYREVELVLANEEGEVSIKRRVTHDTCSVTSTIPTIKSGEYTIALDDTSGKPSINRLVMNIMGIKEEHYIPWNKNFAKKRLTWNTIRSLFCIDENAIGGDCSILLSNNPTKVTHKLAALLFLINGNDFSDRDEKINNNISIARREAVRNQLRKQIQRAAEQNKKIQSELSEMDDDILKKSEDVAGILKCKEDELQSTMNRTQSLLKELISAQTAVVKCSMMLSRYRKLKEQYQADIERLSFIVEGEREVKGIKTHNKCPICGGVMEIEPQKSCIQAAKAELASILINFTNLTKAENEAEESLHLSENRLNSLRKEKEKMERLAKDNLQPIIDDLKKTIESAQRFLCLQIEHDLIDKSVNEWEKELNELDSRESVKSDVAKKFHPKDWFSDDFYAVMSRYAREILRECGFRNLTSARFSRETMDVEVNGEPKGKSNGKGYRAYLNTVMALMLNNYLFEHAVYNPELLIVDTPLLGFDELEEFEYDNMRSGLFNYFLHHQKGQMIVVENLDHIPNLDFEAKGVNVIKFTKKRGYGRYGFLYGVY